jgi:hypothetical protein
MLNMMLALVFILIEGKDAEAVSFEVEPPTLPREAPSAYCTHPAGGTGITRLMS